MSALASVSAVAITQSIGGRTAAWLVLPIGLFSPFLIWSSAMYQEGLFLCLSLSSIALILYLPRRWYWLPDLMVGLLALTRYEGWIFVVLYMVWRKEKQALLSLWGPLLWLGIKWSNVESYSPSPVDYADWNGILERFDLISYLEDWWQLIYRAWYSWGLFLWIFYASLQHRIDHHIWQLCRLLEE